MINNKSYFLALNRMNQVGPRTVSKLLLRWPDLGEMFSLSEQQLIASGLPAKLAHVISSFDLSQVDADWHWEDKANHFLLTWEDPDYPSLLKEIHDPPVVLYAIGQLACLNQPTIAMVGTRQPSSMGRDIARRFASELSAQGISIVSGLALGIDAQSHWGCLDVGGKTIAVMGTGIDCIYPRRHVELAMKISQNGLLLSEFPLKTPPMSGHFPRRNRIISGLSYSILVIEAAVRSGSLVTARLALEQNRDVLAIPGSINNPQSQGCHYLLQQGATLVTSSADVLAELGLDRINGLDKKSGLRFGVTNHEITQPSSQAALQVQSVLADENINLVKCIDFEITTIDEIIERSCLTIEKVVCDLAELELQGFVKSVPGGYMRCSL